VTAERQPTDPMPPTPGAGPGPIAEPPSSDPRTAADAPIADGVPVTAPPLEPPAADPPATAEGTPVAAAPAASRRRRGSGAARGALRVVQFAVGVGLFAVGLWLGTQAFQATQAAPQTIGSTAVSNGVDTPPVVAEFAGALGSGGADAVRSSVSPEVFALLASELQRWQFSSISKVEVLSTTVDGPRTATGLVLTGPTSTGQRLSINLIVQTDGGRIATLR
jgi:hypothetical protein